MTIADRKASERDLIPHYISELRAFGGPRLDFDGAWTDYCRHVFYAFCMAICPPKPQVEDVCVANAERVSAAILDLDTLNLI